MQPTSGINHILSHAMLIRPRMPFIPARHDNRLIRHAVITLAVVICTLLLPIFSEAEQTLPVNAGSLRVGFYDLKPLVFKDERGMPQGLFCKVLGHIAEKEHWTLSWVHGSWPESLERLNNGEIDVLVSVSYSEERARSLDFNRDAVATDWGLLYRHKNSRLESMTDLAGKRVSVMRTGIYTNHFKKLAEQFDVRMEFVERENYSQIIADVESGKSYAGIGSNLAGMALERSANVARSGIVFSPIKVMYAVRKGERPEIIRAIDRHLEELKADHGSVYYYELERMAGKPVSFIPKEAYWAIAGVAAALLLAAVFIVLLKRQVRLKTEELRNTNIHLREQSELMTSIINGTTDAVFIKDVNGRYLVVNDEVVRLFTIPRSEIIGHDDTRFFPLEEARHLMSNDKSIMADGRVVTRDEYITTLGSPKVYQATKGPVYDENGNVTGLFGISRDITEIKQSADALLTLKNELQAQNDQLQATEEKLRIQVYELETNRKLLRESEERYRLIMESVAVIPWEFNVPENRWTYVGPQVTGLLGYAPDEWTNLEWWLRIIHPDDHTWVPAYCADLTSRGEEHAMEYRLMAKDGTIVWVNDLVTVEMLDGKPHIMRGIMLDVTEKKRAELAQRQSEEQINAIFETSSDAIGVSCMGIHVLANPSYLKMFGYNDIAALKNKSIIDLIAPSERERIAGYISSHDGQQSAPTNYETIGLRSNGEEFPMEVNVSTYTRDNEPQTVVVIRDITERKAAERERARLEDHLHQTQKIESVGRLAGGVAHDFNNMLGVIIGYTQLALMDTDPSKPIYSSLEEIQQAAERSADLTQQLLAFARKQTILPKVLDLNDIVTGMLKMLQRLIGENVNLAWQPATGLWPVKVDPSQIDQILANLCVNARDSLTDNGRIVIMTENRTIDEYYAQESPDSTPGDYVALTVSDNGCGMDHETMTHIFEPFFTTKGVGEGTGLGLATVYGAIKQNGGFITVYSEPDMGTQFIIHLPRYTGQDVQADSGQTKMPLPRGNETILLVEDEAAILNMASILLTRQGYTVLKAQTPGEAVELARESAGEIRLLMTDVIMPETNGKDLAKQLQTIHPNLKILFMSGYTADVIAHHGVLDDCVHFIQKPFSLPVMAAKIREVLDDTSGTT